MAPCVGTWIQPRFSLVDAECVWKRLISRLYSIWLWSEICGEVPGRHPRFFMRMKDSGRSESVSVQTYTVRLRTTSGASELFCAFEKEITQDINFKSKNNQ